MSKPKSLGDRMKAYYEKPWQLRLPMRMPVIIRVDGKSFHTFTRHMERPYCRELSRAMQQTAVTLCEEIQGCVLAYGQSDEISLLVHNYKQFDSQAFFDNEIQKLCSITASVASSAMTLLYQQNVVFDARVFVLPEAEVVNYFLWRQQDAARNSIQMLAQSLYSPRQLWGRDVAQLNEMCFQKGMNWDCVETYLKRGFCVKAPEFDVDLEIPKFNEDRDYINLLLEHQQ